MVSINSDFIVMFIRRLWYTRQVEDDWSS